MQEQSFDGRHVLRLEAGEEAISTLIDHLADDPDRFGFLSAAGGVRRVKLGYWDAATKAYQHREFEEQLEVLVLQGNISLKDGRPFPHLHAVFGRRDFSTIGGHVVEAEVYPTLEVWLRTERARIERRKDPESGLDLLDLRR
jgi:uncharacterized protein